MRAIEPCEPGNVGRCDGLLRLTAWEGHGTWRFLGTASRDGYEQTTYDHDGLEMNVPIAHSKQQAQKHTLDRTADSPEKAKVSLADCPRTAHAEYGCQ